MDGKYTLVATGGITHPQLEINVYATTTNKAIERSKEIATRLSVAGYFGFNIYPDDSHERIAHLSVTPQPPTIRVQ